MSMSLTPAIPRFAPEAALLDELMQNYGLGSIIDHLSDKEQVGAYHQVVLAQQLRLTPVLAPRVFGLLAEVCAALSFDEQINIFVHPDAQINAFALHRIDDQSPHMISLTSEMVKSMTDDELRFALGHEVGHLAHRHYRVMMVQHMMALRARSEAQQQQDEQPMPQLLERRLLKWQRLAELTADRAGFAACGEQLPVAVSAFFKMSSGLGPEHLNFAVDSFLAQLAQLRDLERSQVLARFSHPATPVRVRALQLYSDCGASAAPANALHSIDVEIELLAKLMDYEASTDLAVRARDFLVAGGLLAAHVDGNPDDEQMELIIKLLLQVTGDPEAHLENVRDVEHAEQMLEDACAWLTANAGQERFALLGQLAHVVARDGKLTPREQEFMLAVGSMLGIPERAAREILHDVLTGYVRSAAPSEGRRGLMGKFFGRSGQATDS